MSLRVYPTAEGETVSVQGRLHKHATFWLNDLDSSSLVRGITFPSRAKFKYKGLNLVSQVFENGDYSFTLDLKSGYHHVHMHIHADFWTYLGFSPEGQAAHENFTCSRYCFLLWFPLAMCLQNYLRH